MKKPNLGDSFAANIREARIRKKMTQSDVAEGAQCSLSYVSMLELGRRDPALSMVEQFAKALDVEPHLLLKPNIRIPSVRASEVLTSAKEKE